MSSKLIETIMAMAIVKEKFDDYDLCRIRWGLENNEDLVKSVITEIKEKWPEIKTIENLIKIANQYQSLSWEASNFLNWIEIGHIRAGTRFGTIICTSRQKIDEEKAIRGIEGCSCKYPCINYTPGLKTIKYNGETYEVIRKEHTPIKFMKITKS